MMETIFKKMDALIARSKTISNVKLTLMIILTVNAISLRA